MITAAYIYAALAAIPFLILLRDAIHVSLTAQERRIANDNGRFGEQ